MQDFTGVPAIVDLAAMRDAMEDLGGDPTRINPLRPGRAGDRPLDPGRRASPSGSPSRRTPSASSSATTSATPSCAGARARSTTSRSCRRTPASATRSTSSTCRAWSPPATARRSPTRSSGPTRTPRWSTASACSAGASAGSRPRRRCSASRCRCCCRRSSASGSTGELPEGATATDLVLTVTELLREHGVVGRFVEFYGPGLPNLPLADRATIGNMSPEFGSTCAIFPVDAETLRYLEFTGRPAEQIELVEAYAREQGMFHERGQRGRRLLRHARARPQHRRAEPRGPEAAAGPDRAVGDGERLPRRAERRRGR